MIRTNNPHCTIRFKNTFAFFHPITCKFIVLGIGFKIIPVIANCTSGSLVFWSV